MDYNKDYYQELGLDKNASDEDVKKAYRKLAHQHHPDKNQGDKKSENKFQRINEAQSILTDPKSRQEYDQRSPHGNAYSQNPFGNGFEFHFGNGGPGDMFSQFFGEGSPFGNPFGGGFNPFRREEFPENLDLAANVNINLKQIYLNDHINIKFQRNVSCDDCKGTGFDRKGLSDTCDVCEGLGKDRYGKICTYCKGEGKIYSGKCKTCNGEKVVLKDTEITMQNLFQIRSSVRNIQRGYGHQSKHYAQKVGNLILNINLERNDDFIVVNNYELHKVIDVHYQDAIDGSEILYNHIDDTKIKIKLPTKSKNNDILKVKEKGLLVNESNRSDLFLKINIIIDYERN